MKRRVRVILYYRPVSVGEAGCAHRSIVIIYDIARHAEVMHAFMASLKHDPRYLKQDKVKVFLLQEVCVLAAEIVPWGRAARLALGPIGVRAPSKVGELLLQYG